VKHFAVVDHIPYQQNVESELYPKAGAPNPGVKLFTVRAAGGPGFGGPGMFAMRVPQVGEILPSFFHQILGVTDPQKKQLDALQKEVDAKIERILTTCPPSCRVDFKQGYTNE